MKTNVLNNLSGKIKSSDIVHGNNKMGKTLDTILNNSEEKLLWEGILTSGIWFDIPNISSYKRVKFLCSVYALKGSKEYDSGGSGIIVEVDLSMPDNGYCRSGIVIPYIADTVGKQPNNFFAVCSVDVNRNKVLIYIGYNNDIQFGSNLYTVRKIWGVK